MPESRKILLIDQPHPILIETLEAAGYDCVPEYKAAKKDLESMLPDYFGIVMRSRVGADRSFLESGSQLAFLAREGVGIEHIDLDAAGELGIEVITSPEGSRDTVAEHALGMLLSLLNNLHRADREVRAGQWRREPNRGIELKGKTVGILGYGNMGTALARRLSGFGCRVIAYDKFKTDYGDAYAEAVDLDTLQQESDIISLHIPYSEENRFFVDGAFLDTCRKRVFLVNTARGTVLHTAELVHHLKAGKVLGAALDVLEYEETSFNFLDFSALPEPFQFLISADNVILAPHIAGWSVESKEGHGRVLAEKILDRYGRGDQ